MNNIHTIKRPNLGWHHLGDGTAHLAIAAADGWMWAGHPTTRPYQNATLTTISKANPVHRRCAKCEPLE